jgi:iron complex outermembrane receptor protein
LSGDVRLFSERVADRTLLIGTDQTLPTCDLLRYKLAPGQCVIANALYNAENISIRGLEYQFRWQPFDATRLIFNQSFVRIGTDMIVSAPGIDASYQPLKDVTQADNSAPTHTTTIMLMQKIPGGLDLSATYSSVGAMQWSNNTYAKLWQRLDWRLGYTFRIGPTRGELAFTVQNDGVPHAEHTANEIVARRSFATLRLEF